MPNDLKPAAIIDFPTRPKSIAAPAGIEPAMMMERHAAEGLRRVERMLEFSRGMLIEAMGDATEMVMPDGSRYTREVIRSPGSNIEPSTYNALVFHEAPT